MPVIVVGADTPVGEAIVEAVMPNAVEVRAFITDPDRTDEFKGLGAKVATGDVSDSSHVEGASLRCFCAVLVIEAAVDDRERAFAADAQTTLTGWASAVRASGVQRVIWVGSPDDLEGLPASVSEVASVPVDGDITAAAADVSRLEGLDQLPD